MDANLLIIIVPIGLMIAFVFINGRSAKKGRMKCTRCEGTGEINEKWPDVDAPGGWHKLDGICPKCKGKGKV